MARPPRVLLVGPFERDNLGDLLFPLVTERYLGGADVLFGVPFAPSTEHLLERPVRPYGPLLRDEHVDVVWSVGGQLGGVGIAQAHRMAAPPRPPGAPPVDEAELRVATGGVALSSPYVPAVLDVARNAGAITVVNSAGLATLRGARPRHRRTLVDILRDQDAIAVRDVESSVMLTELGIEHRLAPDAVHALGLLRPHRPATGDGAAVVQLSQRVLAQLGRERVAHALSAALAPTRMEVRLLAAGTAVGHDDPQELHWLAERLRALVPGTDVTIIGTRRPWALVDEIAGAGLVIGSSLHVRIIAAAYERPRISVRRRKVTQYAQYWDPHMPYDIGPDDLGAAVAGARAHDRPAFAAVSRQIVRRADAHLRGLAGEILTLAATDTETTRAARAAARRGRRDVSRAQALA